MRAAVATCTFGIFVASKTLSAETLPHLINALLKCTGSHSADASDGRTQPTGSNGGGELARSSARSFSRRSTVWNG